MPYQYRNILNLQADEKKTAQSIIQAIQHPGHGLGSVDFNAITPMPPWAHSEPDRTVWMLEQWGVSDNAGGLAETVITYDGMETLEFNTTGSAVRELMRKLSMMFPQLADFVVDYLWASADVGKDCGSVQFYRGKQTYEYIPEPGSCEAYELSFDIFNTNSADHGLIFDLGLGTYRYGGSADKTEQEACDVPED